MIMSSLFFAFATAGFPAVVNPVVPDPDADVISLRGEWEFRTAPYLNRLNLFEPYFHAVTNGWEKRIQVPGCWEAQGIVGEAGESCGWDIVTDNSPKPIRNRFMGVGQYRREVEIPAAWRGRRVWLKVGGVKSDGRFYVNGTPVALVNNYCGTYKYEITDYVTPGGTAQIAAQVSNLVPSRKGLMSNVNRWGGIYRDVELEATPQAYIDDAWVRGDFDTGTAEAHVEVCGLERGDKCDVRFCVEGAVAVVSAGNGETVVRLPLKDFRPWSPEHPNLYTGRVELVRGGSVAHARLERFGIRKIEVCGREFRLNGRPFFFRGFGDDSVYPLTGLSPADRDVHREHLAKARRAGFNFVRLHTHCELPEYFDAADELGILVQPELPYYNDQPTEGFAFDPKRDVTELWRHYRRHPSFAVYSMGNEGSFGPKLDVEMHRYVKAMDPDRLKINQDCQLPEINPPESSDYVGGPASPWPRGSFDPERPFIAHEYLNLCVKSDSRDEAKYSGAWLPPVPRKSRAEWLARFGIDHEWGDRIQDAQHVLQGVYLKLGLESARLDPYCDGYCFWTIADVVVRSHLSYSAQGLLNPFWEEKRRGLTLEGVAQFNSPVCVLLEGCGKDLVVTSGERLKRGVFLANYGESALRDASLEWLLAAGGCTLASGRIAVGEQAIGGVRRIAELDFAVPDVPIPGAAKLVLAVNDAAVNEWDCWIFPPRETKDGSRLAVADVYREKLSARYANLLPESRAAEAELVIAPFGSSGMMEALARGQRVLSLEGMDRAENVSLGWWWMGLQVGTALREHPALAGLPHDGALTPLLFRTLKIGRPLPMAGLDGDDILVAGEGCWDCYVYLAQALVGEGRLLMSFGLDCLAETPEAAALLDSLVSYACSERFTPKGRVELQNLNNQKQQEP